MTKGQERVVLNYTPLSEEQKSEISRIKQLFADMINDVEKYDNSRLVAMVQTKLEDTCMYYVKLIAS